MGIKYHKGLAKTTIQQKGSTIEEEEQVGALLTAEPVTVVGISCGFTRNMGNYNSAKVHVSLSIPSKTEDIDDVFEFAKGWVDSKLEKISNDFDS